MRLQSAQCCACVVAVELGPVGGERQGGMGDAKKNKIWSLLSRDLQMGVTGHGGDATMIGPIIEGDPKPCGTSAQACGLSSRVTLLQLKYQPVKMRAPEGKISGGVQTL